MIYFKTAARYFSLLLALSFSMPTLAVDILAVISPRNAPDVLSGAHQFLTVNPAHSVTLRTTDQFNDLTEVQRLALIKGADLVFVGGVFGDSVSLFDRYLQADSPRLIHSFVAVHSDRRLVAASRVGLSPHQ